VNNTKALKRAAIVIWGTVVVLILGLLAYQSGLAKPAITLLVPPTSTPSWTPTPAFTATDSPTLTITFTPTSTVTATPTETYTPSMTPTETPLPYASGPMVIGLSVEGRPIEAYRFGTGPVERLTVHGIHGGNEYNTILLADQLIDDLTNHPERIPPQVTLYIVRSLNPDGEAHAHGPSGRANAHGVDLNRNFDAYWRRTWDTTNCFSALPITAGPSPFSEPESAALRDFVLAHHFSAAISYHSAGLGVLPAGQPPEPKSVRLAKAIASVSYYRYPPLDTGCQYSGDLTDWTALQGIPSVDLELNTYNDPEFAINLKVLETFLTWQ
jgi:predicted deacylase